MAKKSWFIYTRNIAGTTLYSIGLFVTKEEAREEAIKSYAWYRIEPEKYKIVIS